MNTKINTKYENSDENHIILDTYSKIWCIMSNKIDYIEINENINLNFSCNRIK